MIVIGIRKVVVLTSQLAAGLPFTPSLIFHGFFLSSKYKLVSLTLQLSLYDRWTDNFIWRLVWSYCFTCIWRLSSYNVFTYSEGRTELEVSLLCTNYIEIILEVIFKMSEGGFVKDIHTLPVCGVSICVNPLLANGFISFVTGFAEAFPSFFDLFLIGFLFTSKA